MSEDRTFPEGKEGEQHSPRDAHFILTLEHAVPYERASPPPLHPQEGAGKHYSYDRCRYLINAVSFMKAFITPEASKPWEKKAAARSSAFAVS